MTAGTFLFHLSTFPQITADIHLIFVLGSHLGFFFLVTGILLRFIFGPLPFFLVFFLVQVMVFFLVQVMAGPK